MKRTLCTIAFGLLLTPAAYAFPTAAPAADPLPAAPHGSEAAPAAAAAPLAGTVVDTMESGGYTYIQLKQENGGKSWVAIPQTPVKVGSKVEVMPGMDMIDFKSTTLKRTFDKITFSNGLAAGAATAKAGETDEKSPGSKGAVVKSSEKVKVEKAAGATGHTVAELYKDAGKLDKKKVTVKGKVVKVSKGIMGKNWVHLQDGTGDAKKGTHNLVVTTQDLPSVGQVVTMGGTLYKDKDFGAGYRYAVIVEEGQLKK